VSASIITRFAELGKRFNTGCKIMLIGALDIGGTKTIAAVAEYLPDGGFLKVLDIIGKVTFPTGAPVCSFRVVASECARIIAGILKEKNLDPSLLGAIGVSAPGMVDAEGRLIYSPVTGWRDVDIAGTLRNVWNEYTDAPELTVRTDCDVNACALAEVLTSGSGDMLWVTVSTGIGGAYVTGGKAVTGYNSVAGEIGHTKVEYNNPRKCSCGQYGCAEAHASGTAVGKIVAETASSDRQWAALFRQRNLLLDAEGCALLAREGDSISGRIMNSAGDYLGRALANAVNLLDPAVVYIGGGMSRSFDLLAAPIRLRIESDALSIHRDIPVLPTALGYEASLMGAFALAADKNI
jgi:glucokinase